jgi:hypothetical protein
MSTQTESGSPGTAPQVVEEARKRVSQAGDVAAEAVEQGEQSVGEQLDRRSTDIGSQLRSTAGTMRRASQEARQQGDTTPAQLTDRVADTMDRLGGYLEHTSGHQIVHDIEGYARRNPAAIAGVGLIAGFVAARMLRASSGQRSVVAPPQSHEYTGGERLGYGPTTSMSPSTIRPSDVGELA